jgi:hypothetical protein
MRHAVSSPELILQPRKEKVMTTVVDERVAITRKGTVRCPVHGEIRNSTMDDYKAQDPAPCGCAFVWDETQRNILIAVPSRRNLWTCT